MGYTHYYTPTRRISYGAWQVFKNLVQQVLQKEEKRGILFDEVRFERDNVTFNGFGEDSCETFFIGRFKNKMNFCKTSRQPYDTAVVACLEIGLHLGILKSYSSDGGGEELQDGRNLAKSIFDNLGK